MKAGILDYGGGNLRSVVNALLSLGHEPAIISRPEQAADCTHLLLPGQGEFGDTLTQLRNRGLADFLVDWIRADRPYFGICVGYQILFDGSEESPEVPGLGIIPGQVGRFQQEADLKIPQMGWNSAASPRGEARVWRDLGEAPYFYYIHSFFPKPAHPEDVIATTTYGTQNFAAAVERGNIFACQFHPEKSQQLGLRLLKNFLEQPLLP
jgi:imidazole glycerol-phosphate synthase subunit HisH